LESISTSRRFRAALDKASRILIVDHNAALRVANVIASIPAATTCYVAVISGAPDVVIILVRSVWLRIVIAAAPSMNKEITAATRVGDGQHGKIIIVSVVAMIKITMHWFNPICANRKRPHPKDVLALDVIAALLGDAIELKLWGCGPTTRCLEVDGCRAVIC
jgi:hypothetical protein